MEQSGSTISKYGKSAELETAVWDRPVPSELPGISFLLDKSIAAGLLALLVVSALAHGSVEPWSVALFELTMVGLLLVWGIRIIVDRHLDITIPATALPIFGLLLLGLAQCVAVTGGAGQRLSLSLDVEATRHAVTLVFFLAAAFVVAANFLVTKERLLLLGNLLTVFGAIMAAFALIQYFTWDHRLYWLRSTDYTVFGPFVNYNHFAGYMAMLAPIPLALMLTVVRGQARLIYGTAAVLMGTAAVISRSRSGVMSLTAALIFMAVMSRWSHRTSGPIRFSKAGPIALVGAAIVSGVLWIGAVPVIEHFGQAVDALVLTGSPDLSRAMIWRDTMGMIRDHPVGGAGLGTYQTVYPAYAKTQDLFGLNYAHNDYVQILAEGGAVGGILAVSFIAMIMIAIRRGLRSIDPLFAGMSLAAGAGITAVLIQSLSDTDLQIPSNALLFLVLCAVVSRIAMPEVVLLKRGSEL